MARNFYSHLEAALADGASNLVAVVSPDPAAFGLTGAQLAHYETLTNNYLDQWRLSLEPSTRTSVIVAGKRAAKRALKSGTVQIAKVMAAAPAVTDAQLVSVGLNPRPKRMPRPVPSNAPFIQVVRVDGRVVTIRIRDAAAPTSRARADGAVGAQILSHVGEAAPTDPRQYYFEGTATRATWTLTFPDSVPSGATVWLSARWVTGRGIASVASAPTSFTLQGGAIRAAA